MVKCTILDYESTEVMRDVSSNTASITSGVTSCQIGFKRIWFVMLPPFFFSTVFVVVHCLISANPG